jgi:CheY-like chemotaxis protein
MAAETRPDIIFCDLTMPGDKNGFDVAQEIRANPDLSHILLIAVTGFTHLDACNRALEAGFEQVFAKPVKFAQLQKVLSDFRERGQHEEE